MFDRRVLGIASLWLVVTPALRALPSQTRGEAIFGRIVDAETGVPVPDAKATLVNVLDPNHPAPFSGLLPLTVETDATGRYVFPPDESAKVLSPTVLVFGWAHGYGFSVHRVKRAGREVAHDFLLPKRLTLAGRVVDPDGVPIPLAEVGVVYEDPLLEGSSSYFPWQYAPQTTDPDGRFRVEVSPNLDFAVEAQHPDFLPAMTNLTRLESRGAAEPKLPDLILQRGVRVEGLVLDAEGRPAVGIEVELVSRSRRLPLVHSRAFAAALHLRVATGPDGRFVFKAASLGPKDLIAHNGRDMDRRRIEVTGPAVTTVLTLSPR